MIKIWDIKMLWFRFLMSFAVLFEGIAGIITLGIYCPSWSLKASAPIAIRWQELRKTKKRQ